MRVMVIDDDETQLRLVRSLLEDAHCEVLTTSAPIGASNLARSFSPDIVLLDVHIPALDGDRLLELVRRASSKTTQFVLFSAADEQTLRERARSAGADGWIRKDYSTGTLPRQLEALRREFLRKQGGGST